MELNPTNKVYYLADRKYEFKYLYKVEKEHINLLPDMSFNLVTCCDTLFLAKEFKTKEAAKTFAKENGIYQQFRIVCLKYGNETQKMPF